MPASIPDLAPLAAVSTATITMVLLKHGLRNVWLRGSQPLLAGQARAVGPAFTMRFLPGREDLATPESLAGGRSTRGAIEAMPGGSFVVIDAGGTTDAGVMGDILCARMKARGVRGMVTDGVVRDRAGVVAAGLPVWCRGAASPPSVSGLTFAGWQEPVGCGGVAVFPDDVVVADDDGAIVIPRSLVGAVIDAAGEQERLEAWIMAEVERGVPLLGLYPPDSAARARYEASKPKS